MHDTHFAVQSNQVNQVARFVDMYEYDAGTVENVLVFNKDEIVFVEFASESKFLEMPTLLSGGGLVSTAQDYRRPEIPRHLLRY